MGSRELCNVLLHFYMPGSGIVVGAAAGLVVSPIVGSLDLRRGQVGVQTVWGHLEEDGVQVAVCSAGGM